MTTPAAASVALPGILIVDDAVANLELLSVMLQERGYEPRPVPSGKLALLAAQADPPDLILLDVNMPEMDGFEVCARLKAEAALKDIPVIFLSAFAETLDKVRAFSLGAVDYVTKPFQVDEIEVRVRTHLAIRSLQLQLSQHNERLERVVAERTHQLEQAYEQLLKLDRLKADFLRMISHEIRTPVTSVFGVTELVLELCPASADRELYQTLFEGSRLRLLNLVEDATSLADIEQLTAKSGSASSFSTLLAELRVALPDLRISGVEAAALDAVCLRGDHFLLRSALTTLIHLARYFSRHQQTAQVTRVVDTRLLRMQFELNALSLPPLAAASFFELGSPVRSASYAEPLGLAPVVAQKIITTFGGEVRLVQGTAETGYLEVLLHQAD
ncbi:MAG: response regulator [Planctomycetota bacterium]|nr:response regulator [Planctomycetota bacterium]